ncbi:hypothetical protein PTTG_03712 [Puccinia triticina 1-1 BBBD Race 1]|uniref:Uncharacterized protein n=2 Tax=Puccinia triticina TaxID=208348 RepID=A0A180GHT6_PUCT1|nr:uncharacterized protein PtA15_3A246 [Puccinia triticina]OAV92181.1 hypothetical protein PTTG_03712 [Puccinia triticina 1-1 BBBD Race 1]WAQ82881.1 hypothetical protein PtA15_3A246 [Puccinia triticina]WAR53706.1 hypothetical protein PtB15_3B215 [Puccinia triticina]
MSSQSNAGSSGAPGSGSTLSRGINRQGNRWRSLDRVPTPRTGTRTITPTRMAPTTTTTRMAPPIITMEKAPPPTRHPLASNRGVW